ncbi:MAG TPA: MgtC/SapB family protein [Acidimicrobiia bacterium]|jgi:putative Mg2+ transporter-C (MgtC) family protein
MDVLDNIINLIVAAALSAVIGFEREWMEKSAGLRTHMMVGLGSALFTITGLELGGDPSRVAAQIVTGIGFLGAGAIFRQGANVQGLTTASGLWAVAGIGMAAGAGLIGLAITATVIGVLILYALLPVVDRIRNQQHRKNQTEGEADSTS